LCHPDAAMISALFTAATIASGSFGELQHTRTDTSICESCVKVGNQGLTKLLNQIINVGIVGGCGAVCSALPTPTEQKACDAICTIVGINEFAKVINNCDLDLIYACELLKACPAGSDDASISVDAAVALPAAGPIGTQFELQLQFTTVNATGVGEVEIQVQGPTGAPISGSFLNTGFAPGKYSSNITFTAKDNPTSEPPLIWRPGNYPFVFKMCQGECDSKHPHSKVFGTTGGSIQITQ